MLSVMLKRICVSSVESHGRSASTPTSLLAGRPRDPSSVLGRRFLSSTKCRDRLWNPWRSYSMDTGNKPAKAWRWQCVELYLHTPHKPSWHAQKTAACTLCRKSISWTLAENIESIPLSARFIHGISYSADFDKIWYWRVNGILKPIPWIKCRSCGLVYVYVIWKCPIIRRCNLTTYFDIE